MLLAFGITFELPVVTFFLARVGVVTHRPPLRTWRYATVVIFIVAAVLTPGPDVASQLLMATPLLVLYWLSIGVAWLVARPAPAVVPAGNEGGSPAPGTPLAHPRDGRARAGALVSPRNHPPEDPHDVSSSSRARAPGVLPEQLRPHP